MKFLPRLSSALLALATPAFAQTINPPSPGVPSVISQPSLGWVATTSLPAAARPRSQTHPARLANVSIRAVAGNGSDALIAGAAVRGAGALPVLVRGVGPGLRSFGVSAPLRDPSLELYRASSSMARAAAFAPEAQSATSYVGAFPLVAGVGATPGDAALLGQTATGTFTAHCRSATDASGVALLELYDATATPTASTARFVNFSSRARVGAEESTVIVGFVVAGEGELQLLLRGVGPTLAQVGVTGSVADPSVELYAGNTRIAANDNWGDVGATRTAALQAAARAAGAFDLANPADAALLVTLRAGAYSLHVRGAAGQSGIALAEIHEVTPAPDAFEVGYAVNSVGLDLYRRLAARLDAPNLALSPYSIQSALGLTYVGARTDTRAEMARVLRFPDRTTALQSGFAEIRNALVAAAAKTVPLAERASTPSRRIEPLEWHAANRLFGQEDFPFRPEFLSFLRDGFGAPLENADFDAEPEVARLRINAWVADQTRQRIPDLLPRNSVHKLTRLVLVNALYLKARWDFPFETHATSPQPFYPTATTVRQVPTMAGVLSCGYAVEDGMTVLSLDFMGGDLHYLVILPAERQSLASTAARLTADDFARWSSLGIVDRRSLVLRLPKSKIADETVNLTPELRAAMPRPFDRYGADFDGIVPRELIAPENIYIDQVLHKAFVEVTETGTEAAAATAVSVSVTSSIFALPLPPTVRVDRPFLFAIQHRATGTCLFLGHVSDPQ